MANDKIKLTNLSTKESTRQKKIDIGISFAPHRKKQ